MIYCAACPSLHFLCFSISIWHIQWYLPGLSPISYPLYCSLYWRILLLKLLDHNPLFKVFLLMIISIKYYCYWENTMKILHRWYMTPYRHLKCSIRHLHIACVTVATLDIFSIFCENGNVEMYCIQSYRKLVFS